MYQALQEHLSSLRQARAAQAQSEHYLFHSDPQFPFLTIFNSYYNFVGTSDLVINTQRTPSSSESAASPTDGPDPSRQSSGGNSESQSSSTSISKLLPASLPSKIVPGDGSSLMKPSDNVTLVSLLFTTDLLSWVWLCDSPDTVGQIFNFGPQMVASALNISKSELSNSALVAYQKLDTKDVNDIAAVYLLYVPNDAVEDLQQLVYSSNSHFYDQEGLPGQIANQVDPSLKLNAFVSSDSTTVNGDKSEQQSESSSSDNSQTTIVAVCSSFGGVIAVLLATLAFRRYRSSRAANEAPNLRQLQLGPGSPPAMAQHSPYSDHHSPVAAGHARSVSGTSAPSAYPSQRPDSYGSGGSLDSGDMQPTARGVSWYSGHYTNWNGDEPQTVFGAAIADDQHSPFADQPTSSSAGSLQRNRDEGVRRLKTGQVAISRPQLAGNSLM